VSGPCRCQSPVAGYMLVRYAVRQDVWCGFLCASHTAAVPLSGPLDQCAAGELHDRQEQHRLAMAGKALPSTGAAAKRPTLTPTRLADLRFGGRVLDHQPPPHRPYRGAPGLHCARL
jgi:hypothetical protein